MRETRIEEAVVGLETSLGVGRVALASLQNGVVTIGYHRPMANTSSHIAGARITKGVPRETAEDRLKRDPP